MDLDLGESTLSQIKGLFEKKIRKGGKLIPKKGRRVKISESSFTRSPYV